MNRYVIVCLIKGKPLEFHEKLVEDVCYKFKVKRQKLSAHFTIKAPFEMDNIKDIENLLDRFAIDNHKSSLVIDGFDHFRSDVAFMKIIPSKNAIATHDKFINNLKQIPNITWKRHEGLGKDKIFHCTIVSRIPKDKFSLIWNYINKFNPKFDFYFDNISILKWNGERWIIHKQYKLK